MGRPPPSSKEQYGCHHQSLKRTGDATSTLSEMGMSSLHSKRSRDATLVSLSDKWGLPFKPTPNKDYGSAGCFGGVSGKCFGAGLEVFRDRVSAI